MDGLLSSLQPRRDGPRPRPEPPPPAGSAWRSILTSRLATRPGAGDLLNACAAELTQLRGDGCGGGDDPTCTAALGRVAHRPCVLLAQDRRATPKGARPGPGAYRKAQRAMRLATELRLPLVTVVDTPGVELSPAAEQGGLSAEIARCLEQMTGLPSPTLSVLLGEGAGGGALALLGPDRIVCAEHAWLLPISPEGASAIVYRSPDRAGEIASAQRGASWDLKRFGLVEVVVSESPGWLHRMADVIATELDALLAEPARRRLERGRRRIRAMGKVGEGQL